MDLGTLREGTPHQQEAYHTLVALGVFDVLSQYHPTLTGTIPIDLDVESSDLDIVFEAYDLDAFEREVARQYGGFQGFESHRMTSMDLPASVTNFTTDRFPIQFFAQPLPVERQPAYRHMIAEARLLMAGDEAKKALRHLRKQGLKTESAFGLYFGLTGDPYEALYRIADLSDDELKRIIGRRVDTANN